MYKHISFWVLVLGFLFVTPSFATAVERTSWSIPAPAAERGYTIFSQQREVYVGLLPGVLHGDSSVRIDVFDEQDTIPVPPQGWKYVSPYIGVIMKGSDVFPAVHPLLAIQHDASIHTEASIVAFYDEQGGEWHTLPSSVAVDSPYVRTRIPFSYAKLAALAPDLGPPPELKEIIPIPSFDAHAIVVMDTASRSVLYEYNADEPLPLASLTKLISAKEALDSGLVLDRVITYDISDDAPGSTIQFSYHDALRVEDVLIGSLVKSGNNAARFLARATGIPANIFAMHMTQQARELGLATPQFVEPTGLHSANISSARDFAILADTALSDPTIFSASTRPSAELHIQNTGRILSLANTNWWLADNSYFVTGSKTGYLPETWGGVGSNLVVRAQSSREARDEVIIVVLGAPNRTSSISTMNSFLDWAFRSYTWDSL